MKGKYTVKVSNNRVAYTLELERNITILTGESGIGKTALARLIQNFEDAGRQSGVTVQCKVPCRSITSDDGWESRLNAIHNSIIFIDEGRKFLQTKSFAETVAGNDNYFVLITRESLSQIPYSVRSILTLKNTKRIGSKHYSRTYERFDFISHFSDAVSNSEYLLTEDSNAGFEAYEKLTEGTSCVCNPFFSEERSDKCCGSCVHAEDELRRGREQTEYQYREHRAVQTVNGRKSCHLCVTH